MKKQDPIVSYFYDEEVGNYCLGGNNPMRPHRARMTHSLLTGYNLDKKLVVNRPQPRTFEQLTNFHADEYIQFLKTVTPDNQDEFMTQLRRFNMGVAGEADCPVFDGMYQFCQLYSGASVNGAAILADGKADICVNWSGGMHHAKKGEASGFCYVNDIVLAILELLKVFSRVLYVDIDIHHGDGVEEAFYLTDRVMTVSFHKYGDFFPGTGALADTGHQKGKHYSVNVPLRDGMDDQSYKGLFEPIMQKVMEIYQPGAIVVCAGADSLSGDKLGCFNLSIEGHSNCLEFLSKFNTPMLVLGGGGYTLRNVARCWCYETASLAGVNLPDLLPETALAQYNYYLDTARLRIAVSNMRNSNTPEELEKIRRTVLENLSHLPAAPSAHISQTPAPLKAEDGPEEAMDERGGGAVFKEQRRVKDGDESEEEDDGVGARREQDHKRVRVEEGAGAGAVGRVSPPKVKAEDMEGVVKQEMGWSRAEGYANRVVDEAEEVELHRQVRPGKVLNAGAWSVGMTARELAESFRSKAAAAGETNGRAGGGDVEMADAQGAGPGPASEQLQQQPQQFQQVQQRQQSSQQPPPQQHQQQPMLPVGALTRPGPGAGGQGDSAGSGAAQPGADGPAPMLTELEIKRRISELHSNSSKPQVGLEDPAHPSNSYWGQMCNVWPPSQSAATSTPAPPAPSPAAPSTSAAPSMSPHTSAPRPPPSTNPPPPPPSI